ncbi:sugar ABC transporter ATP-binding protein [Schumannella luteola]|uniref:ABC-type sugar transport system ATPase subunit n=1 Tax=Schumannella luteola TaxID=472059 RepID=A0A852YH68_9MICO|nr:sugar ABC transporter ATP-binding protein [Schumannella luteola]NYG98398.1 ABC-type sugar transport system ATPase subunit [Schumannella luteola]TPW91092.1 sugar ABC transporter ATP-binding protein [Schumannella luteola]
MTLAISAASKSYGSFRVLHDIDFEVGPGEVHALLGPNGAGKSTLIKCLGGVQGFDGGTIDLDGEPLNATTPAAAFEAGVATIHQHLSLIDSLSVSDNIFLGREIPAGPLVAKARQRRETQQLLDQFGIPVSPTAVVGQLPVGIKQLIEIAKAWHRTDIRVLILDEPTSALAEDETLRLFSEIERLKAAGARIIYTTHRLGEIYRIADRVTVIRDGGVALTGPTSEIRPQQIVAAIAGTTTVDAAYGADVGTRRRDESALTVTGLSGPRFGPIDLDVRAGEIVGLYGVLGSGRSSLLETIAGRYSADAGDVTIGGRLRRNRRPSAAIRDGLAFVPSDRATQALWATRDASENMLMPSFGALASGTLRVARRERAAFAATAERLELQPPDPRRNGGDFSGGNQQKIVLGRWLQNDDLRVLVLDEPTQGVDVGARQKIYETCYQLAERGVAVLFASSDADEIVKLADRVVVVDQGRAIVELSGADITERALLSAAHELV